VRFGTHFYFRASIKTSWLHTSFPSLFAPFWLNGIINNQENASKSIEELAAGTFVKVLLFLYVILTSFENVIIMLLIELW